MNSYAKAAQSAAKYLGEGHPMTQNMNEVLTQATKKIAGIIQKTMNKNLKSASGSRSFAGGMAMGELENMIRSTDI